MFLFRGDFGSVLHTGDFRLHSRMGTHIPDLLSLPGEQIGTLSTYGDLAQVFLDNTFCHPLFDFPPREEVLADVLQYACDGWPCLLLVAAGNLGKEPLLRALAQRLQTRIRVPPKRAAFLRVVLGDKFDAEFQAEPQTPLEATADDLRSLSAQGCIWVICMKNVERIRSRAAAIQCKCRTMYPTGWAPLLHDADDDDHDIRWFPYSDHSSFPELVQFLLWLPAAPVTLLTPLSCVGTKMGYDGEEGAHRLVELAQLHTLSYCPPALAKTMMCKQPPETAATLNVDNVKSGCLTKLVNQPTSRYLTKICNQSAIARSVTPGKLRLRSTVNCGQRQGQSCSKLNPTQSVTEADSKIQSDVMFSDEFGIGRTVGVECKGDDANKSLMPSTHCDSVPDALPLSKRRRLPWQKASGSSLTSGPGFIKDTANGGWLVSTGEVPVNMRVGEETHAAAESKSWPPKTGTVHVDLAQKRAIAAQQNKHIFKPLTMSTGAEHTNMELHV
eukprot:gnl/MRDRNA2_/MRDRNA2_33766_c0_seq1.p1 gnl/MRDRNA2_/MRDRNA2_33766_c0~~gnl/MRDRNA2_/MRDRNA2_33766_c0_seq1.p1  ORF type:complete len:549 (-),score=97.48 gnl/MRDRNA2_/MRDRNA2_33766_c0_seq1:93-1589(-)